MVETFVPPEMVFAKPRAKTIIASVALLPPTLVASIYGMNLQFPEFAALGTWAYPYVVTLMALSAVLPMWYCYRRGWLR